MAWEAESKELQHQLEEASIKTKVETIVGNERGTEAEQQGYRRSHEDRTEFFREFLETLAPDDFHQEGYFEAYVKYIEDCCQARTEGKDPEPVEFQPLTSEEDSMDELEDTAPLDGEAVV